MSEPQDELLALLLQEQGFAPDRAAAIEARSRGGDAPLSSQQKRLWFLQQLEPANGAYVIPAAVRVTGRLDTAVLQRTLDALVARHASLRTVFAERGGEPVQHVLDPSPAAMRITPAASDDEAIQLALDDIRAPFDLATGPLFRAHIFTLAPDEALVVLAMHHIVSDGWSIGVLVKELVAIYAAETGGRSSMLSPLPLQYADFASWQEQWRNGDEAALQLAYWTRQLAAVPRLELIADHPRPAVMTHAGGTARATLDAATTTAVRAFCRASGTTPFMVLLAAFAALLHRDTGQSDLAIGTPAANRNRAELEGLIGFFINALVIRADVSGQPSFRTLVDRVKRACLDGWAHQDVPFELLVETLQPERTASHNPLFQVMFVLQNAPEGRLDIPGLTFSTVDLPTTTAKFDLSLYVVESGATLSLLLEYNRDLVEADTAAAMLDRYRRLLTAALAEPDRAVGDLGILAPAERAQILAGWNGTATNYPRDASVQQLFREVAATRGQAVAATFGDAWVTYTELDRRSNQLARALRAQGVERGAIVGLAVERSLGMLVGLLGILKADAAFLPLDLSHPEGRRAALLDAARARMVVTPQDIAASGSEPDGPIDSAAGALDLAYVMFTSGSTGVPKGVAVEHRAIVRLVRNTSYARFGAAETVLQFAPLAFDASTFEIWGALLNGGALAIAAPHALSLRELAQMMAATRVTTAWLTAGLFHQMVEQEIEALGGLRQVIAGGDVLSPAHVRRLLDHAPATRVINGFGPTESTTFACCHPMTGAGDVGDTVSIGRPIANTRAYILDARFEPVPVGVAGELFLGGDGLARGYLHRPDLTAERFVPNPFGIEPGERLYATGDVARWRRDGTIDFIGRRDDQVKLRGFRVEPREIERAITAHPGVRACIVTVGSVGTSGSVRLQPDQNQELAAYIVGDVTDEALRTFLRERLPDYMMPSAIVRLDALPLTANGKVDRARLPAPAPRQPATSYTAPATPTEVAVARIWAEILRVERVGSLDHFFELGGHSLLATRVIARVRDELQTEVPLRALFTEPTVAAFALEIDRVRALGAHTGAAIQSRPRIPARTRK